jgi:hypothetical protein
MPTLTDSEAQAVIQRWLLEQAQLLKPAGPAPVMPRTQTELQQALAGGLRATFDSWAESEIEIRRNQHIPFIILPESVRPLRQDGLETTSQGYLIFEIAAARTGLQSYIDATSPTGRRVEYRSLEEITHPDSLASWMHAPLTLYHQGLITLANSREHKRGYIFAGPRIERLADGEDYLIFAALADDPELVEGIRTRKYVEGSAGYDSWFVGRPGEHRGVRYDGLQTLIRINHEALLPPGMARAGRLARVQLDAQDSATFYFSLSEGELSMSQPTTPQNVQVVRQVRLDATDTIELEPAVAGRVERALSVRDSQIQTLNTQVQTLTTEKTAQTARADSAEQRKTELETENATLKAAQVKGGSKKLLQAYEKARPYLPQGFKIDSLDDDAGERQLQELALKGRVPDRDFSKESDEYVRIYFDSLISDQPAPPAPPRVGSGQPSRQAQRLFDQMDELATEGAGKTPVAGGKIEPQPNRYWDSIEGPTKKYFEEKEGA